MAFKFPIHSQFLKIDEPSSVFPADWLRTVKEADDVTNRFLDTHGSFTRYRTIIKKCGKPNCCSPPVSPLFPKFANFMPSPEPNPASEGSYYGIQHHLEKEKMSEKPPVDAGMPSATADYRKKHTCTQGSCIQQPRYFATIGRLNIHQQIHKQGEEGEDAEARADLVPERIAARRVVFGGQVQFFVHWQGHDDNEACWESRESMIERAQQMVVAWEAEKRPPRLSRREGVVEEVWL